MRYVLALALAVAVAACGDDDGSGDGTGTLDKSAYEDRFRAVGDAHEDDLARLRRAVRAGANDPDRLAVALYDFGRVGRATAEDLDALEPPADIADEHQGYVDVLMQTAAAYDELAQDVGEASTPAAARAELAQLREVFLAKDNIEKANAFVEAIREGGYDLGIGPGDSTLPGQSP